MKAPGSSLLLFACMLFVSGIGPCVALDCYSCIDCEDPFDPTGVTTMTCPSGSVCNAQSMLIGDTELFMRGCTEADLCTPGCVTAPDLGTFCGYCCDDGDLCNSKSIADAVEDILHCYLCAYSSDPSASNFSSPACNDPFDANGAEIYQSPCADGQCGVTKTNFMGTTVVTRMCFSDFDSNPLGECIPRCDALSITCQTCCSDNLCNDG
ncbi:uncharacterized protein LOC119725601 [Patiria miniata]|uniref:Uncharacterized protein n=1 Tax=Patiria miniata TaxID=46514 RepID=A0A913ZPL1_PATMI|nr:uncharacterized protein LOC119725601 [Patiria miniata]XP_038052996.1 uncharacterized protein LOC119725601 [Patiria miniata]